jgi:hypothetical protein
MEAASTSETSINFYQTARRSNPEGSHLRVKQWFLSPGLLIALMMEAARTSETLVNFYQTTRCYNPEDSNLQWFYCVYILTSVHAFTYPFIHLSTDSSTHPYIHPSIQQFTHPSIRLPLKTLFRIQGITPI